jgi:hypothetical protein
MQVINVRNVHQALPEVIYQLRYGTGVARRESRNGPVIRFPTPVTTVYQKPAERVIFWPERDANPFFHLIESIWMLAGRRDVDTVASYVKRMRDFSDNGKTLHGAYGWRWRNHFGFDQLDLVIETLRENPDDRRQVLSMWDAHVDLGRGGKDLPCNLQVIFEVACDGRLDMLVTNRSNDIIMGAYGANAVHFSYLHEYMARCIGVPQGVYRQVSNNFHAYVSDFEKVAKLAQYAPMAVGGELAHDARDPYETGFVTPFPLMSTPKEDWDREAEMFLHDPMAIGFQDPFFRKVAVPLYKAHVAFRSGHPNRFEVALAEAEKCAASDWRLATVEWIQRRQAKAEAKAAEEHVKDDGVRYE